MKFNNKISLNVKLLIGVLIPSLLMILISVISSRVKFASFTEDLFKTDTKVSVSILESKVECFKNESQAIARILSSNPNFVNAVLTEDREMVNRAIKSIIGSLKIDFITVTDKKGNVILRTHSSDNYGDNVSNQFNISEALKGNLTTVIEEGTIVKLSARTGAPIFSNGNVIGVISTGFNFDSPEFLDALKQITGNEFTFFLNDLRINTTILKEGKRLVGTRLDPKVADIVLKEGKTFNGEAEILGIPHITAYKPIYGPNNKIIGIYFSGAPMSGISAIQNEIFLTIILISAVLFILFSFSLNKILKKMIVIPLQKGLNMMRTMSKGVLNIRMNIDRNDEIGQLGQSMDEFAEVLQNLTKKMHETADGNLDIKIEKLDEKDEITPAMIRILSSLNQLVNEANILIKAAVEGKLDKRGDSENFKGGYKLIVEGVNNLLDAVINPIKEGSKVLEVMSNGNLTVRVTGEYKGDHQIIKNSINRLGESLGGVIGDISEAIQATASASSQISSSSEEMAAGAQEQSQQATEVAGAVEEMTKTIVENTKNASFAAETANDAGRKAKNGGEVVKQTIEGMNRIADVVSLSASTVEELGKSSNQIGAIVQVIDDIADQTNLLALNAAIEAARAGEQGRGFAVVADEVRKLAERTTKATKEIADMIKKIQTDTSEAVESMKKGTDEVVRGKELANKAGQSLEEIIQGAEKVADIIRGLAATSEEQSAASEQISKNIEAISSVTQQSAAGTQQIAHAAEDLNRLTINLQDLISGFKIDLNVKNKYLTK